MNSRQMSKQFTTEYLNYIETETWKAKSKVYYDLFKSQEAYKIIIEKSWKRCEQFMVVKQKKKKIGSFRSSFRKELKKIENSENLVMESKSLSPDCGFLENLFIFLLDQEMLRKFL